MATILSADSAEELQAKIEAYYDRWSAGYFAVLKCRWQEAGKFFAQMSRLDSCD